MNEHRQCGGRPDRYSRYREKEYVLRDTRSQSPGRTGQGTADGTALEGSDDTFQEPTAIIFGLDRRGREGVVSSSGVLQSARRLSVVTDWQRCASSRRLGTGRHDRLR